MKHVVAFAVTTALLAASPSAQQTTRDASSAPGSEPVVLAPTDHPQVPRDLAQLWMAPPAHTGRTAALTEFASAVKLEVEANFAQALPIFSQPALQQGPLGDYALFYKGLAELRLGRAEEARRTFQTLQARGPVGYLAELSPLREAESDEALGDQAAALAIYERLASTKTSAPDEILVRMGRAAKAAGDSDRARAAFARVYYEFPFSDLSTVAATELDDEPIAPGSGRYRLELGRAERLFGGKKYAQARTAFEALRSAAQGDDRELVNLRLAECDYFLKRPRNARDGVRPYLDHASRRAEALFFYAVSVRELGDTDEYLRTVREITSDYPAESWAEEALNNLATQYILQSDDEQANATFRELYEKFPKGRYAERAAWKIGWWQYKQHAYADTIRIFEHAAADFPRSDYRPSWLYWSARAHDAVNDKAVARERYTLVALDYANSYYGRLALSHLDGGLPERRLVVDTYGDRRDRAAGDIALPEALPPNAATVRALLGLELYDQALDELRYAQKVWGDSPPIEATIGWIYHRRGDLRAGINAVKRAYPQYMAAGGEKLPTELLRVLFPVNYWPTIRRYSAEHQLDPYLIAALIAQESTFTADIKSAANAYGLMQLLPSTGRQYARVLHLGKRFSIGMLTSADTNVKMGTAYFADKVKQFGGVHYALASYNAGENRVVRWMAERPGADRDEFIDDIPFPETQNYVKRILGTADDYRRLYGGEASASAAADEDDAVEVTPASASAASTTSAKTTAKKAPAKKPKKTASRRARKTRKT